MDKSVEIHLQVIQKLQDEDGLPRKDWSIYGEVIKRLTAIVSIQERRISALEQEIAELQKGE